MERITYTQIEKLTAGHTTIEAQLIEHACQSLNRASENITAALDCIERAARETREVLAAGGWINPLGVFQHQPADVDRLIAERSIHARTLGALLGDEAATALLTGEAR